MRGKKAILTGASAGLGRVLALQLAGRGVELVLAARRGESLQELVHQIEQKGGRAVAIPTDVSSPGECRNLIREALLALGRIDYLILNAGVSMWAHFEEISDPTIFDQLMKTNYLGVVYCLHPALPHLIESHGMIVTVTSAQAILGMPLHTGYTASKHAVKGLLEALEIELNGRVDILNVMPGWIRGTDLRANAFVGDGTETGSTRKHSHEAVSPEECATAILQAMEAGRRELYIPSKLRAIPWLKLLFPGWLRKKIRRSVDNQPESRRKKGSRRSEVAGKEKIPESS